MITNALQSSCPRETDPNKEAKIMCFNFCNIWQILCQMAGFGC